MPICEGRNKKSDAGGVTVETFPKTNLEWDSRPGDHANSLGQLTSPRSVLDWPFPKWPIGDDETGKIALNEWPLWGAPIASLRVRLWAEAEWPELVESGQAVIGLRSA